jgi:hypothetical protein
VCKSELFREIYILVSNLVNLVLLHPIETGLAIIERDIQELFGYQNQLSAFLRLLLGGVFFGGPCGFVFVFVTLLRLLWLTKYPFALLKIGVMLFKLIANVLQTKDQCVL